MGNKETTAQRIREMSVGDIAHGMVQCTIASHGLRMAMEIIRDMQSHLDAVVRTQQERHPEDWPELKRTPTPPPVPAQSAQMESSVAKNTTKIPQIPRVSG